jgi:5-formyltetrahydrofolate cyclo-ligase
MDEETRLAIVARAKIELRKRLRALRHTTPASALAVRSERIAQRVGALSAIANASSVALFWPIEERHEVDLRALDATLRKRGVEIAYPCIAEESTMTFRFATPDDLVLEALGFRGAPPSAREAVALDAIVVPAIALDASGNRLGYGAGFYDRALARFPDAIKIGVAYDFQLLAEVPVNSLDVAMNVVVSDARTIQI